MTPALRVGADHGTVVLNPEWEVAQVLIHHEAGPIEAVGA